MKILKIVTINLLIFLVLILTTEIIFGSWFKKNNFGFSIREMRNVKINMSVEYDGKKYDYIFKRTILLKTNDISSINDSYHEEVQHIVNVSLLKNIFKVINDSSTFSQVQNISNDYLSKIILELSSKKRKDYKLSKYSTHYVKMINDFYEDPEEYKIKDSLKIPDGSPIGSDNCSHNPQR